VAFGLSPFGVGVVWEPRSGNKFNLNTSNKSGGKVVGCIAWSPDGETIATGDPAESLNNAETGELVATLPGLGNGLAFSPDGELLARGDASGLIVLVRTDTLEQMQTISIARTWLLALDFSPDGKRLAAGGYGPANILDLDSSESEQLEDERFGTGSPFVRWRNSGKTLVASSWDMWGEWNSESGKLMWVLPGRCQDLSSDERLAAVMRGGAIHLVEFPEGRPLAALMLLDEGKHAAVSAGGHIDGSPGIEDQFVYVALTEDGRQVTLPRNKFETEYGWENDPSQVRLPTPETDSADVGE
jgi:WD40 repeat protein